MGHVHPECGQCTRSGERQAGLAIPWPVVRQVYRVTLEINKHGRIGRLISRTMETARTLTEMHHFYLWQSNLWDDIFPEQQLLSIYFGKDLDDTFPRPPIFGVCARPSLIWKKSARKIILGKRRLFSFLLLACYRTVCAARTYARWSS